MSLVVGDHHLCTAGLLESFAATHPGDVVRRDGETFFAIEQVSELLAQVRRSDGRLLGIEGFLVSADAAYPALDRIADFSGESAGSAIDRAEALVTGPWSSRPDAAEHLSDEAHGRHMIAVVLAD